LPLAPNDGDSRGGTTKIIRGAEDERRRESDDDFDSCATAKVAVIDWFPLRRRV
jgi:hypothetical protein